ncbi:MAG: DUF3696 domain-containing protein [Magnetococcales bacterium]|nr:DUF3696 domain-containing protein [Magnetococcales bacterium]
MISRIRLLNFKCFGEVSIPLANLTLMTGLNGMGKSSAIQSLLVLRQSFHQGLLPGRGLALNGDLVNLGTAKAVLYEHAQNDHIGISLAYNNQDRETDFLFGYDKNADILKPLGQQNDTEIFKEQLFTDQFQYLHAERLGPRVTFPVSHHHVREHRQLGSKGEYASHFLSLFGSTQKVPKKLQHSDGQSDLLVHQVAAWLGEVSPGVALHLSPYANMDVMNLEYSFPSVNGRSDHFRASSVGFGITYTLPIIVALLAAEPGDLLIMENPEAHLHPQGQVRIGELISRVADAGVQLIIETHSDHILNGIRVAVRQKRCTPDKVAIHYFSRRQKDDRSYSDFESPKIDKDGRIDPWPSGFFDEWEKSLENLL